MSTRAKDKEEYGPGFSARLAEAMRVHGMTQVKLAAETGSSQPVIHKLLRGSLPSSMLLMNLSHVLCVTPEWLMFGVGPMLRTPSDLTISEQQLMMLFRKLDPEARVALLTVVERMV